MPNARRKKCAVSGSTTDKPPPSSKHFLLPLMNRTTVTWSWINCPLPGTLSRQWPGLWAEIWRDGRYYTKAGIMINNFSPNGVEQLNLCAGVQPQSHSDVLMTELESINHSGLGKVRYTVRGIVPGWQMKREILLPAYTTQWKEFPVVQF